MVLGGPTSFSHFFFFLVTWGSKKSQGKKKNTKNQPGWLQKSMNVIQISLGSIARRAVEVNYTMIMIHVILGKDISHHVSFPVDMINRDGAELLEKLLQQESKEPRG